MRTLQILALSALLALTGVAKSKSTAPVRVKPYVTKKGTLVKGHARTAPDKTRGNNWSTKGHVNPMTGKKGTKPLAKPLKKK